MDIQGNTRHYVVIRTELLLAGNAGRLPSVALEDFVDGNLPYCTSLEVKCSELHGNGIYARKPLLEGEVVEYAPSVLLMRMGNLFVDYRYSAESLRQGLFRLLLGNGSIYNHSAEPNLGYRRVRVDRSSEAAQGLSVCFYAKRDIAAGEELLISYGKTWWSSRGIHDATGVPQAQLLLPEGRVTWLDEQVSLATWCYA
ncbi:SET domain-containing protein 7 [Durusdinium trenchii]|uniref:SET domain-containing protein 7 n=1 Tax=Durusdinium trenchii TaxID=1381693 RepID=A0ABP0HH65_9DINO